MIEAAISFCFVLQLDMWTSAGHAAGLRCYERQRRVL